MGVFLAVSLLLANPALATPGATPQTIHTAPFGGRVYSSNSLTTTSCGRAAIPAPAHFSLKTGDGSFRDRAIGKGCASIGGDVNVQELASNLIELVAPVHFHSSGSHSIVVSWAITVAGGERATLSTCLPGSSANYTCAQLVTSFLYVDAYLYDVNTGIRTYSSRGWNLDNQSYNFTYCASGSCSSYAGASPGNFSVSKSLGFYLNATLNQSHTFQLVTYLYGGAQVEFLTTGAVFSGTPSGSAWLNLATGGNGAVLRSLTIT